MAGGCHKVWSEYLTPCFVTNTRIHLDGPLSYSLALLSFAAKVLYVGVPAAFYMERASRRRHVPVTRRSP